MVVTSPHCMHVLLFLSNFLRISVASGFAAVNFTTKPKDADYFVESDATLRWEYSSRKAIQYIKFGILIGDDDVTIVVKDVDAKEVQFNSLYRPEVTESFIGRVDVVKNEQASFRIKNLTLNDTGRYFFSLDLQNESKISSQYVQVTVVDIITDRQNSTQLVESWIGHKVSLICIVTKASPGLPVDFDWRWSDNTQVIGKQVYWKGKPDPWKDQSQMTIETNVDRDFEPVTCIAKSRTSTQRFDIGMKQLYKPREPINVTAYDFPSNETECPMYSRLTWEPPEDDGGTPLTGFVVEYKHPFFTSQVFVSKTINRCTEHVICKLQSEFPREVHVDVRAINRVGQGFRSRTVLLSFFKSLTAPLNLTSKLVPKEQGPYDVWVTWSPPEEDGGAPLVQYSLEYKELESSWNSATVLKTNNTYMWISKTREAYVYEVRVTARNKFGLEKASNILIVHFGEKPDEPQDLVKKEAFIDKQNKPKIKVMWKPPRYDGGAAITHYHVEYKTVRKEWSSAEKDSVKNTEYTFQVDKSETYTFRTKAVNKLGIGKPAVITVNFTADDVKNLAVTKNSTSSTTSASFGVILLFVISNALA